jgi:hypothetical protein
MVEEKSCGLFEMFGKEECVLKREEATGTEAASQLQMLSSNIM